MKILAPILITRRSTPTCQQKSDPSRDPHCKDAIDFPAPRGEVTSQLGTGKIGNVFLQCSPFYVSTPRNSRQRWVSFRNSLEFS
jgi:hypothetical protein